MLSNSNNISIMAFAINSNRSDPGWKAAFEPDKKMLILSFKTKG